MKAIYYTVTFLAALVVLGFAGWQGYLHRNEIVSCVQKYCEECNNHREE